MIDGALVVDATVHGFNFHPDNWRQPWLREVTDMLYSFGFDQLHPLGDPRYRITFEEFVNSFRLQPRLMERVLFAESRTDVAVYHGVPMYGLYGDGSSPIAVGQAIRERLPHRMFVYGDVSPWQHDAIARVDELVDDHGVIGLKLYPADFVDGRLHRLDLRDEQVVAPLIAHARDRGIRVVAVHKAVPLGPIPMESYRVTDIGPAAAAFPDVVFEIVHGGFAFADETAELLARHPNVSVNLETLPCYALNFADKFARMLAPLLAVGAHDRIFYGTGATGMHPQPFVEAFWRFRMPPHLPQLTEEDKRGMLGANFARQHGWDVDALLAACAADEYGLDEELAQPWSVIREAAAAAVDR